MSRVRMKAKEAVPRLLNSGASVAAFKQAAEADVTAAPVEKRPRTEIALIEPNT